MCLHPGRREGKGRAAGEGGGEEGGFLIGFELVLSSLVYLGVIGSVTSQEMRSFEPHRLGGDR